MRAFGAALGVLLLAGCSSHHVTEIDLTQGAGDEVVFFVVFDEANAIARTTTPLRLDADGASGGEAPSITLERDEASVVLVRFGLDTLVTGYEPERFDDLEIRIAPPPAERTRRLAPGGRTVSDSALPPTATLARVELRAEGDALAPLDAGERLASGVRTGLTLTTPIDPEFCRNVDAEPLRPFGAAASVGVVEPEPFGTLRAVAHVEPDVLLVGTGSALYVLRRGGVVSAPPLTPGTPGPWLPYETLAPEPNGLGNGSVAVDPTTAGQASRRVVLTVETDLGGELFRGYVFELTYQDGTIGDVVTATVVETRVRDVAFAEDGSYAVVGDEGTFVVVSPDGAIRAYPIPPPNGTRDEARTVVATQDPEFPWIAGTRNRLHRLAVARGAWSTQGVTPPSQESLHFVGLTSSTDGAPARSWALGAAGLLMTFEDGEWVKQPLLMPPAFGPCSPSGAVAEPELTGPMEAMAQSGGYLYTVAKGCTGFPVVRETDRCVSMLAIEGRPVELVDDFIEAAEVSNGELVVVGHRGEVYAARVGD